MEVISARVSFGSKNLGLPRCLLTKLKVSAVTGWILRARLYSFSRRVVIAFPNGLEARPLPVTSFRIRATGAAPARRARCRRSRRAIDLFHRRQPRFLDEKIKWRPKFMADSEIVDASLSLDD